MINLALRGIVLGLLCHLCVSCPIGKICDGKQHNEIVGDSRLEILEDSKAPDSGTVPVVAATTAAAPITEPPQSMAPESSTEPSGGGTTTGASPCITTSLAVLAASLFLSVWLS